MFTELFSTPAMIITTLMLIGIEIASLLIAAGIIGQYTRVNRRTGNLVRSLGGTPPHTHAGSITYAIMTILIGLITAVLYVFQPHFL